MPPTVANARFDFVYTVNGSSVLVKLNSLVGDGPVRMAADHYLVTACTFYSFPVVAALRETTQHALEQLFGPSLLFASTILSESIAFAVKLSFFSKLLAKLDAAGKLPLRLHGDFGSVARLLTDLIVQFVDDTDRTLKADDILSLPAPSAAHTHWTDKLLIGQLSSIVFDVKTLLCHGYVPANRHDDNGTFRTAAAHLLSVSNSKSPSDIGKASEVIIFLRGSQTPLPLRTFVPSDQVFIAISRRALSEAARFPEEFAGAWHDAYGPLKGVLKQELTHDQALLHASNMLTMISGTPQNMVHASMVSLCARLKSCAVAENLDSDSRFRDAEPGTRSARAATLVRANRENASGSDQVRGALSTSTSFVSLVETILVQQSAAASKADMLRLIARAEHPVGLIFLAGTDVSHHAFGQLKSLRLPEILDDVLTTSMAKDVDGEAKTWRLYGRATGYLTKLLKGDWNFEIFQLVVLPVIEKQYGLTRAQLYTSVRMDGFWAHETALRDGRHAFLAFFAIAGYCPKDGVDNSLPAFYAGMAKRAAKIAIFPDTLLRKNQLMVGLAAAGDQIFTEAAEQHRIMLRDPLESATRRDSFHLRGGEGERLLGAYDEFYTKVRADFDADSKYSDSAPTGSTLSEPHHYPTPRALGKTARSQFEGGPDSGGVAWGAATDTHGIYTCDYGLILGGYMLIAPAGTGNIEFAQMLANCIARVAPNKSVENRHKWCNKRCTHASAHAPLGEPSDYTVIHLYKPEARAHPDYVEFANPSNWTHLSGPDKRAFHQAAFDKRPTAATAPVGGTAGPAKTTGGRGQPTPRAPGKGEKGGAKGKGKGGRGKGAARGRGRFDAASTEDRLALQPVDQPYKTTIARALPRLTKLAQGPASSTHNPATTLRCAPTIHARHHCVWRGRCTAHGVSTHSALRLSLRYHPCSASAALRTDRHHSLPRACAQSTARATGQKGRRYTWITARDAASTPRRSST